MKKLLLATGVALSIVSASAQIKILVIHNSPDPAADTVDVYVKNAALPGGEQKIIDNFPYRGAFFYDPGFPSVSTSTDLVIAPKGSTSSAQGIFTKTFSSGLAAGNYLIVANGLVDTNYYSAAVPAGNDKSFDLDVYTGLSFTAANPTSTKLTILHGALDAPPVTIQAFVTTIQATPRDTAADNLAFRSVTPSFDYPASPRRLHIYATGTTTPAYQANGNALKLLGGASAVAFASGFLSPPSGGAAFGVFAAVVAPNQPNGYVTVAELKQERLAGIVEIIHSAADPIMSTIEMYVNGIKQFLTLNFRQRFQSSAFIQDFDYNIDIHPKDSSNKALTVSLNLNDTSRVGVIAGVANTAGFTANPDGKNILAASYIDKPFVSTASPGTTVVNLFHASTDAPTVSATVPAAGGLTIISGLSYGQFQKANVGGNPLLPTSLGNAVVEVRLPNNNVFKSYIVPLGAIDGKGVTVVASGFVDSAANKNGRAFGLFLGIPTTPLGPLTPLKDTTILQVSVVDPAKADLQFRMFPNPASNDLIVGFDAKESSNVSIDILDLNGRVVKNVVNSTFANETYFETVDIRDLNSGLYIARVKSNNKVSSYKFNVVR